MMNSNSYQGVGVVNQFEIGGTDEFVGSGPMDDTINNNGSTVNNNIPNYQTPSWYQKMFGCFESTAIIPYFDVDTADIKERLTASVTHANSTDIFRESILHREGKRPDLYGPIWICMTLTFFLAVTSNTSQFLKSDYLSTDVEYDISHLMRAFSVLLFYTFGLPLLVFFMFRCVGIANGSGETQNLNNDPTLATASAAPSFSTSSLSLIDLICIYGYSLVPFLPATVLLLIPSIMLEWLIIGTATGVSLLLILRNLVGPVMRSNSQWTGPVAMILIGIHIIFCLVLKFSFYHHKFTGRSSSGGSDIIFTDDGTGDDDNMSSGDGDGVDDN